MKLFKGVSMVLLAFISLTLSSCRYPWTIEKRTSGYKLIRDFENAGEQEDFATRQVFRKNYETREFEAYKGDIECYKNKHGINFKFDSALIIIGNQDSIYSPLFTSKVIRPGLIGCNSLSGHFIIINELSDLEKKHKKRFSLWVFQPECLNPQVVLIEIIIPVKNKDVPLSEFVENASLTFVYLGWIIL